MGLLDEFLCALTPIEREQISKLPLKGKEDLVLRSLMPLGTDCIVKPPQFDISIDHLNKIQSVLLRKCFDAISDHDDIKLIRFLNQRNLNKHLDREIQRLEKELKQRELTPEELRPYYKEFFLSSVDVLAKYSNAEQSAYYQKKYLALVPKAEREMERCNTNAKFAYPYLVKAGMAVMTDNEKDEMGQYLLRLYHNAQKLNHLEAKVLCLKNLVYYHNYTRPNLELRYHYLTEMEHLVETAPEGSFSPMRHAITQADVAEFLFSANKLPEAFEKYRAVFNAYEDLMANKPYHCSRYMQVATLCGAYTDAWYMLEHHCKRSITHYHASLSPMAACNYVMYYLHLPDLANARKYLDVLNDVNNKQEYLVYDIYYRALETTWLWISGEHDTANTAAIRHIKFLRSHKVKQNYDPICLVFPLVQALYKVKLTRAALSKKHLDMQGQLNQGHFAIFGRLLV